MSLDDFLELGSDWLAENKIDFYRPYPWQAEFHAAGVSHPERLVLAGNRTGKTFCAAAETAYHLTGVYPDWWQGRRFDSPVLVWVGSVTNEASRDIVQKELIGDPVGTGAIPSHLMDGKPKYKQAGVQGVADTIKVKHVSGGSSTAVFKTYEQGWRKWQGAAPHVVWLDEEPSQKKEEKGIFSEALTRILTTKGIIYATLTPLLGMTELVRHFMNPPSDGIYLRTATWDNSPHLDPQETARMLKSYPDHERETRALGVPMMGEGKVFTVAEDKIRISPIEIPNHWARICGIDFGSAGSGGHPSAAAWMAWDRDGDVIYVYDCYRVREETTAYLAEAIKGRGQWIPCSWPHDGLKTGPNSGLALWKHYRQHGVKMLSLSARYDNEKGGGQDTEPIVVEVLERMMTGRFKVFSHLDVWFEEFRNYHRDGGRIVAVNEDVLKATFYGVMMRRYAIPKYLPMPKQAKTGPIVTAPF